MKLARRVAIITGAAAGIGEASARQFAREGARLVLVDLQEDALSKLVEELEQESTIVLDVVGDVSSPSLCQSVIDRTTAQFGRLDIQQCRHRAEWQPGGLYGRRMATDDGHQLEIDVPPLPCRPAHHAAAGRGNNNQHVLHCRSDGSR